MPKDNIEKAVAKGSGAGAGGLEEVMYETYGPSGTAVLITAVTDNVKRTSPEIRHLLSKAGFELGAPGSATWAFIKKEGVYIPNTPMELNDSDGEKLTNFVETIEEHADVQDVFTTADSIDTAE